jgi:hypothetical protein
LEKYLALVRRMENYFRGFSIKHIDRNKNAEADELAKAAARKNNATSRRILPNNRRLVVQNN